VSRDYPIDMPSAIDDLERLLDPGACLTRSEDMAPYLTDWRGRFHGTALAVARPATTAQVAQVVRWCAARGTPVVIQGGNTGLAGGATPGGGPPALVLSTRRLNRIRAVDLANDTLTAEAGCVLHDVQQAALASERLFPLSLAAQGSCTIGGNLSTNAGGTQVLRYGNARELTLGLEVVLPDGQVWEGLRGLRKDNSGYDLKQLFIGAEGTLGIITAATLRLFPRPTGRAVAMVALDGLPAAIALLAQARAQAGPALTAFELLSDDCLQLLARTRLPARPPFPVPHPWLALLEWVEHGTGDGAAARCEARCEALGAAAIAGGLARDAVVARSLADGDALWRLRESIPEAQARAGGNVKHDIALPLGAMAGFVEEVGEALRALWPPLRPFVFGHLGDGNLHYNVGTVQGIPVAGAFEREPAINDIVFTAVVRHGGSISAEHGLGQLRRDLAERVKPAVERELMRSVKRALDPSGLMNPGKVI